MRKSTDINYRAIAQKTAGKERDGFDGRMSTLNNGIDCLWRGHSTAPNARWKWGGEVSRGENPIG